MVDVAGVTFDQVVERSYRSALGAYKYANHDRAELQWLIAKVERDRGEQIDLDCFVNDRRFNTEPDGAGSAAPHPYDVRMASSVITTSLPRGNCRTGTHGTVTQSYLLVNFVVFKDG
ncbi:MAG TPA: hypothetical protein VGS19_19275 [Streptosporangiaceae bacterium]|nr:hypothetical protein [Streptosporangiaceae bacterium]